MRPDLFPRFILPALMIAVLTACASLGETGAKKKEKADTYLQLGVRYMNLNKLDIAKENLEKAVDYDSGNAEAHNSLAFLYEKMKQYDDAENEYETALNLNPDDVRVQNNFGRFLCDRGETDKGLALLAQAGSDPLNERPWIALTNAGRCLLNKGDRAKAEPYLRQALESSKAYAPALAGMQKISYQKGDLWAAKGFLERYLSVASHTPETLFVAFQTERALGNTDRAKEYRNLLLEKFPLSNEANKIRSISE
ncbi:type IV pilus biogenesis/stability protein PilW [Methylosarcina fibrata]|uniref:type IV pilus biogenesis/stability protein PilW n=1 Tax=Methylosarcina fibrata TaxID=105972 RepID=UPI001E410BB7|nr:type IV pilus biogenesis/stability protein PilW [Methylosarcina fibrata]